MDVGKVRVWVEKVKADGAQAIKFVTPGGRNAVPQ